MNLRKVFFNKYVLIFAVLLIAGSGYYFWESSRTQNNEARYRTQIVERGDLTQLASANGTLNPVVLVNVGTQVSGTVKKWYADFNDHVKEGQKLLELDPALYAAQVQQTSASLANVRSQLKLAEANAARARELFRQEYISRQELDTSVQALEAARAQVALVSAQLQKDNTNLGYSVIRSPVSGVVVSREVDIGQTVAASFQTPTLFKIAQDLSKMQIDSSFAEADVGNIKVGQSVNFRVDAFPNRSFRGSVKQVRLNPTTQQNVVTYDVVIAVDNPDQSLMPGMTAYVNIVVAQRKNVLLVPNAALRFRPAEALRPSDKGTSGDKPQESRKEGRGKDKGDSTPTGTVYLLDNGQLKPVKVSVGITDNRRTEVTGGDLAEGAAVVVEDRQPPAKTGGPPGMRLF
ncbi:MAG: efflux RND transporter periplasmic adaptor subunit [Betaproteobacteria bacterium]|nr:efflux RND transporter periplasmic adaptor subunit [Betaproteobacteria bacterium]